MSDHFSGPRAIADPAADIADLYVFPSPERPGHLVLVMTVFPAAMPGALFSDAVAYRFRLRPVTIITEPGPAFEIGQTEYAFSCTFAAPVKPEGREAWVQMGACTTPAGEVISFRVNDEPGADAKGLRLFAGLRLDPFFIDLLGVQATEKLRRLAFKAQGANVLAGQNVLSIVVETEIATLFGGNGPLFAVAGETLTSGKTPMRLERVGRPEIKNVVMSSKEFDLVNRDLEIRDLYNQEDPFRLAKDYMGAYRARLNANLAFYDSLDGKTDWPPDEQGNHPLTDLLLADFLVVDVSKPYVEDSCFELEQALLHGRVPETCGGRSLNDDIVDSLYTLLVNGGNGPRIRDGIDGATRPASRSFPYLVSPNPNPPDLKAKAAALSVPPQGMMQ